VFVFLLSSFLLVSVPYGAKQGRSGQSGFADFEYDISILIKRRFPVAHHDLKTIKQNSA